MEVNPNNIFIKSLKMRLIFPFYIKNVNEKFFSEIANNPNKRFIKKILPQIENEFEKDDIDAIKTIESLKKPEKIQRMINSSLKKIAALTGKNNIELFTKVGTDEFQEPLYIKTKGNFSDLEILGDVHEDRRFSYSINIDPECYLFNFIEQLQLAFYLDHETNRISGGFSLNWGNSAHDLEFDDAIETVFIQTMIKKFWKAQLYPMSLENILTIAHENRHNRSRTKEKSVLNKIIDFDQVTIEELQHNWSKFLDKKFLKFKNFGEEEKKYYEDQLFYSVLIVSLIMLYLLQEINTYFTSRRPELILGLLSKPAKLISNEDQTYKEDFDALTKYLYHTFYDKSVIADKELKKIKDANDLIEVLSNFSSADSKNIFLGEFISTYETLPIEKIKILDKNNFLYDYKFKSFFLMLLFPEIYSLSIDNPNLIEYQQLFNSLSTNQDINLSDSLSNDIDESICEMNYDYASFITSESILIIKNNDPLYIERQNEKILVIRDENRRLYNNYFWAVIYLQSKIAEKNNIESKINKLAVIKVKYKTLFYKEALQNLDDLQFDWYDHFYGLPQIKKIVKKLDDNNNFKNSLEILSNKIKNEDEISKKETERNWIILAFIIALLNALIDFISCVFSILPNKGPVHDGWIYTFIGIAVAIAFVLFFILLVSVFRLFKSYKKSKNVEQRKNYEEL